MAKKRDSGRKETRLQKEKSFSRRDFFKSGAAAGVSAAVLSGQGQASAQAIAWNYEVDVVVCGAGCTGLHAAIRARDLGASSWQALRHVVVPIILPSLIGVGLFGFTLSYDEFARTLMTAGTFNTLPLEIYGMTTNVTTPVLYALGTVTTGVSFAVIALALASAAWLGRRRARHGSDAGKAA